MVIIYKQAYFMKKLLNKIVQWEKYIGIGGFFKFLFTFFILGVFFSPIVLHLLNPNIWEQLKDSDFSRSLMPILFLCFTLSILPFLIVGIVLWYKKNKAYKLLLTNEEKYKDIEIRSWRDNDKIWDRAISYSPSISVLIALLTLPFLLTHNAPSHNSYPLFSCVLLFLFGTLYSIYQLFYSNISNDKLFVPNLLKIIFIILLLLVIVSVIIVLIGIKN